MNDKYQIDEEENLPFQGWKTLDEDGNWIDLPEDNTRNSVEKQMVCRKELFIISFVIIMSIVLVCSIIIAITNFNFSKSVNWIILLTTGVYTIWQLSYRWWK
tara:strand:+ start:28 stop:333 length:306 start_codon:yes stop_codon:yes gene_type:complete